MQRKKANEIVERFRVDREDDVFAVLRRKLARWAKDHAEELKDIDPEMPKELDDRAADNWRTLVSVGEVAGGGWGKRLRDVALAMNAEREEQDTGSRLLADLVEIVKDDIRDFIPTKEILSKLTEVEDSPWKEYRRGEPITAVGLSNILKRYKLRPDRTMKERGYIKSEILSVASRYNPSYASYPSEPHRTQANLMTGRENQPVIQPVMQKVAEKSEKTGVYDGLTGMTGHSEIGEGVTKRPTKGSGGLDPYWQTHDPEAAHGGLF
jgi:hypothetical protein